MPEIVEAQRLAGDFDYILHLVLEDAPAFNRFYERFLTEAPVKSVTTRIVVSDTKMRTGLPI